SALYLCPLRALLNNLAPRVERYAAMIGRRAALWHGDVGAAARRRIVRERPDLLLTTPESLEAVLISRGSTTASCYPTFEPSSSTSSTPLRATTAAGTSSRSSSASSGLPAGDCSGSGCRPRSGTPASHWAGLHGGAVGMSWA